MTNVENYKLIEEFLNGLDKETVSVTIHIENHKEQLGNVYKRKREFDFVRKVPTLMNDVLSGEWRIRYYHGGMSHYYTLEEYRNQVWRRDEKE